MILVQLIGVNYSFLVCQASCKAFNINFKPYKQMITSKGLFDQNYRQFYRFLENKYIVEKTADS